MHAFSAPEDIEVPSVALALKDYRAYEEAEQAYIKAVADEVKTYGSHPLAGELIRVQYADGFAQYIVAKVNGRVCLIHLPLGDGWHASQFVSGATVHSLTEIVKARKAREAMVKERV